MFGRAETAYIAIAEVVTEDDYKIGPGGSFALREAGARAAGQGQGGCGGC